ncbi:MAG TPA: FUSC family protein [Solirubrobacterales bacterium]
MSSGESTRGLFNAGGAARRLRASPLFAFGPSPAGPALRRGILLAIPVGAVLMLELGLGMSSKGGIGTGALLGGFVAMDAPAGARAAWQAAVAPLIGLAAALGTVTGESAALAVATMGLVGALAGYSFAVSLRLAVVGLTVALSLIIAQGLPLDAGDAPVALAFGTLGAGLQALFSLAVWLTYDRVADRGPGGWDTAGALRALRANLTPRSHSARHALRFGAALAVGVGAYWALGWQDHGFWVPLTILFVLRPEEGETFHRLSLRAVGTAFGLLAATGLSYLLSDQGVALALALGVATALAYGTLTVQYAVFTFGITTYAVLLADTLGEPALTAAWQRGAATAIGIVIAGVAFLLWPNRDESGGFRAPKPPDRYIWPASQTGRAGARSQQGSET